MNKKKLIIVASVLTVALSINSMTKKRPIFILKSIKNNGEEIQISSYFSFENLKIAKNSIVHLNAQIKPMYELNSSHYANFIHIHDTKNNEIGGLMTKIYPKTKKLTLHLQRQKGAVEYTPEQVENWYTLCDEQKVKIMCNIQQRYKKDTIYFISLIIEKKIDASRINIEEKPKII